MFDAKEYNKEYQKNYYFRNKERYKARIRIKRLREKLAKVEGWKAELTKLELENVSWRNLPLVQKKE